MDVVGPLGERGIFMRGAAALNKGFLFSSMIFAAATAMVVDRRFRAAGVWMTVAAVLAATGLIHGYEITAVGVENRLLQFQFGPDATNPALMFAVVYALAAAGLFGLDRFERKRSAVP